MRAHPSHTHYIRPHMPYTRSHTLDGHSKDVWGEGDSISPKKGPEKRALKSDETRSAGSVISNGQPAIGDMWPNTVTDKMSLRSGVLGTGGAS